MFKVTSASMYCNGTTPEIRRGEKRHLPHPEPQIQSEMQSEEPESNPNQERCGMNQTKPTQLPPPPPPPSSSSSEAAGQRARERARQRCGRSASPCRVVPRSDTEDVSGSQRSLSRPVTPLDCQMARLRVVEVRRVCRPVCYLRGRSTVAGLGEFRQLPMLRVCRSSPHLRHRASGYRRLPVLDIGARV
jgi:hypothetical protein